jgi:hypothetical protein
MAERTSRLSAANSGLMPSRGVGGLMSVWKTPHICFAHKNMTEESFRFWQRAFKIA